MCATFDHLHLTYWYIANDRNLSDMKSYFLARKIFVHLDTYILYYQHHMQTQFYLKGLQKFKLVQIHAKRILVQIDRDCFSVFLAYV